jgi:autotransporter-associated beta strand protein
MIVEEGTLYFETDQSSMGGTPITVKGGATVGMYYSKLISAPITLEHEAKLAQLGGGSGTTSEWSGAMTVEGDAHLMTYGGNLKISGDISGTGTLRIEGPNDVTLSGSNGHNSTAIYSDSTLRLGSSNALASGSVVTVTPGGTLDFNGQSDSLLTNLTIAGDGVDADSGALVNNSSSGGAYAAVKNLTLADDASVGGNVGSPGSAPGRLDFGFGLGGSSVDLAGHTLTKIGSSELLWRLQGTTSGSGGKLVIDSGGVNVEVFDNNLPETIVNNGGTLSSYGGRSQDMDLTLNEGATLAAYNGTGTYSGTVILGGAATLNAGEASAFPSYTGGSLDIESAITGSGSITKIGGNKLTLSSSASDYTGATVVEEGLLELGHADALGNTSGVAVDDGATLDIAGTRPNVHVTISGTGTTGQGALINSGGSASNSQISLTLAADATIGGTGRFDIRGGFLDGGGYTLTKVGTNPVAIRASASNLAAIVIDEGDIYFENVNQTGLAGTPVIVNADGRLGSYTYSTYSVPVDIVLNGGLLGQFGRDGTDTTTWTGTVTVDQDSTISSNPSSWPGGNLELSGSIGGSGGLAIEGTNTVTFSGENSYTGDTTISGGTLALETAGTNNIADSPTIDLAAGTVLDVTGVAGGFALADGQTLAGLGTVEGDMAIAGGATVAPGASPGTLVHNGDETWEGGGTYAWEINNTLGDKGADPGWDWIDIDGTLTIAATPSDPFTIDIALLAAGGEPGMPEGFDPALASSWEIATATGGVLGFDPEAFSVVLPEDLAENWTGGIWSVGLEGNSVTVNFAVPEPSGLLLAAIGLAWLGLFARRRQSKR